MTTWPDCDFVRNEESAVAPRIVVGSRTGWETVVFPVDDDDGPIRRSLSSLGDAIRSAERFVAEVLSGS